MKQFSKSILYALHGLFHCVRKERNFLIHCCAAALVLIAAYWYDINHTEWMILLLNIGLVMCFEMINTCIERICNFVHPQHNSLIKIIKDVAAGAVLLVAIIAAICWLIIFLPKMF